MWFHQLVTALRTWAVSDKADQPVIDVDNGQAKYDSIPTALFTMRCIFFQTMRNICKHVYSLCLQLTMLVFTTFTKLKTSQESHQYLNLCFANKAIFWAKAEATVIRMCLGKIPEFVPQGRSSSLSSEKFLLKAVLLYYTLKLCIICLAKNITRPFYPQLHVTLSNSISHFPSDASSKLSNAPAHLYNFMVDRVCMKWVVQ